MARRSDLINLLITEFKKINGDLYETPTGGAYQFKSNLYGNVFDRWKFYTEVNDFPTLLIQTQEETLTHISSNVRYGSFIVRVRGYVKGEDTIELSENLLEDLEYVIENLNLSAGFCDAGFVDARVIEMSTDFGLLQPIYELGISDLTFEVSYEKIQGL